MPALPSSYGMEGALCTSLCGYIRVDSSGSQWNDENAVYSVLRGLEALFMSA